MKGHADIVSPAGSRNWLVPECQSYSPKASVIVALFGPAV